MQLNNCLSSDYQIVLVGLTNQQIRSLPDNILGIQNTNSIKELVEWYSTADVFVNPTHEDNYPTTNLEAISCGTPVITYNTGGSVESAEIYGTVVDSFEELVTEIQLYFKKERRYIKNRWDYSIGHMVKQYLELY